MHAPVTARARPGRGPGLPGRTDRPRAWPDRQRPELAAGPRAGRYSRAAGAPILIAGEPGTGKSLVARLLHALGPGAQQPFVAIESSALADEFVGGGGRGSEPEGSQLRAGLHNLSQARGGTLYLDEVGSLPMELAA